ncbi:lactonase family protein [Neolewinella lacunae]|uniref:Lactonase family protein n=1 Tax=Neolewinella lacunae TaxID=1517758 RepID=A0A923PMF6_9BACT|nr:lactonase family protein [Neolewinella lacunae]MBC6996848.1 lactonase family protein [Neolewinella lacunae]MDN3633826.1 lactonase family protein [Neolewinella lacunae]
MKTRHLYAGLFLLGLLLQTCTPSLQQRLKWSEREAYVGTYTRNEGWVNGQAEGIYQLNLDGHGRITNQQLVVRQANPSFVRVSPTGSYLYAVSELAQEDEPTGFLHAYAIGDGYREVAKVPTGGKAPCHIELAEGHLITTNYVGGVAKLYRQESAGQVVEVDRFVVPENLVPGRQPHLHSARVAPDGNLVVIADLGLDRLWFFTLSEEKLKPYAQPYLTLTEGAGPRHTEWSADGRFLYVINELNSTVAVVRNDAAAQSLAVVQTLSTLPAGWTGKNSCADLHLHPNGQLLYGSNRGHNSIAIFSVASGTGLLTAVGHESTRGEVPRNFAISPTGRFLYAANQNSGNIVPFSINEKSGKLTFKGQDFALPTPVCIAFQ